MASNLTNQVRDIAGVTTAVARGDLSRKITVEVQVTSVAHDVGVEGKLGGQADVSGAGGIWLDLTSKPAGRSTSSRTTSTR